MELLLEIASLQRFFARVRFPSMHAFRHTYSTLLNEHGTDVKVQQELLRHADIRTTMNIYTRAVPERLRKANSKLVWLLLQQTQRPSGSERVRCGGSVWESNPPFDSLRAESPALKAGTVTGPFSPPPWIIAAEYKRTKNSQRVSPPKNTASKESKYKHSYSRELEETAVKSNAAIQRLAAPTFLRASSRSFGCTQTSKYGRFVGPPIFPPGCSSRVIPRRITMGSRESPNGNSP